MIDWTFGFFPLLTMMVMVIMGLLAARFVHVDKRYDEGIDSYNLFIRSTQNTLVNKSSDPIPARTKSEMIYRMMLAQSEVDKYQAHRNSNQNKGSLIDGMAIGALIVLGMVAILTEGKEYVFWFIIVSSIIFVIPFSHFAHHKNIIRKITLNKY